MPLKTPRKHQQPRKNAQPELPLKKRDLGP
jgi:hypothetical protein